MGPAQPQLYCMTLHLSSWVSLELSLLPQGPDRGQRGPGRGWVVVHQPARAPRRLLPLAFGQAQPATLTASRLGLGCGWGLCALVRSPAALAGQLCFGPARI